MTCRGCEHCKPRENWKKGQSKHYCDIRCLGDTVKYGYLDPKTGKRFMEVSEKNECILGNGFRKPIEKKQSIWGY